MEDVEALQSMLSLVATILMFVTAVVVIGLFFALVFPDFINKKIPVVDKNSKYSIDNSSAPYLSSVNYDSGANAIIVVKKGSVQNLVITFVTKKGSKIKHTVYNLDFGQSNAVALPASDVDAYYILVHKADGAKVKPEYKPNNNLVFSLIYGIACAGILIGFIMCFAIMRALDFDDYYPSYMLVYVLGIALPLVLCVGSSVGLHFLGETIKYKGGK